MSFLLRDGRGQIGCAGFDVVDSNMGKGLFGIQGRSRRIVLVEVEGRGDLGIAEGIEFRLGAGGGRLLLSELGGFDDRLHGWEDNGVQ